MKKILKSRSKAFAIAIIKMVESLPKRNATYIISNQLVKSSTSIGANYRAALRARSKAELIAKIGIVEEEADETLYWLEILKEGGIASPEIIDPLWKECNELLSIFIATIKTTKASSS
ncbi:four helix bundle protein [Algoriphagus aestuarii]|nr:four helix bundle protein [Algoriphagus aestuarii]